MTFKIVRDDGPWEYDTSVERVRPMVVSWKNLTVELVEELYRAREALDSRGLNRGKEKVPNGTFSEYLDDVGLARTTVHRWLERYVPEERKLLTPEELEERKQIETRAKQDADKARVGKVLQFERTGKTPEDWDESAEKLAAKRAKDSRERKKRIDAEIAKSKETHKRQEAENAKQEEVDRDFEIEAEWIADAAAEMVEQHERRQSFKERIRLSDGGRDDVFVDALMDYLEELDDDNRRIEACTNIIKVARNIAADLQRGTA